MAKLLSVSNIFFAFMSDFQYDWVLYAFDVENLNQFATESGIKFSDQQVTVTLLDCYVSIGSFRY